jgi:D-aspartate ligase
MKSVVANPALVFDCHFNGLGIIKSLGRRGVRVYALDSSRKVGTWSRYARFWRCPDPLVDEAGFIDCLLKIGPGFKARPVLFPTNDQWATAISKHKEELQAYYIPCVADWETIELIINKDRFYPWAAAKGYPVPRLYSRDKFLGADFKSFPVAAKPKYRRISNLSQDAVRLSQRLDRNRMVVLKDRGEYENYLSANKDILPYITFQEYVPGMADCMYTVGIYADEKGEVLGLFTGRKVRGFPPDIGDCIVGQSEGVPAEMIAQVKKMVKDLSYQGIAEFEFKKNVENGEFRLIEVNPRSWSWVGITPACGVDLPWIAYADLTGIESVGYQESTAAQGEVKYVRLLDDFKNCVYSYRRAGFADYSLGVCRWRKSLRAKKRVYAEFSWDDPVPGLYYLFWVVIIAGIIVGSIRKVLSFFKSK